ncbi:MAG: ABC transporter permease [Bacteroidetes bacterium]|nr:ABC transporter permease [Bacteroidota bacterium]
MQRYYLIFNIALEAVMANKFRSFLTTLGIIFGVAAVISMMAIGNGAKKEILDQMKLVGVNNIVITPSEEEDLGSESSDTDEEGKSMSKKFSPGLTLKDAESLKEIIPTVVSVSPEVTYESVIIKDGRRKSARLNGVTPAFFDVYNMNLENGIFFNDEHMRNSSPVCIIGPTIKANFFPNENPLGKYLKCGHVWFKVIGVLEDRKVNIGDGKDLGVSNYGNDLYVPLQTALIRFKDRALINAQSIYGGGSSVTIRGGFVSFSSSGSSGDVEKNQLDKIVVQVNESKELIPTTEVIQKMLFRRHSEVKDFEVKVPELLLKQEQRTKDIFNIVLAVIAGISLIVGGIGIMNIMLASVLERTKEIGVRQATGARRKDIIVQFLMEAILISISGGFIGIVTGVAFSRIIMETTGILTIISFLSIVISFGVSAAIGILFGYMPAKRAAEQDPVVSLRYE